MRNPRGSRRASVLASQVGDEVLLARATQGLTREQAATLSHLSPATFARVEAGYATVQVDTMVAACEAVGLNLYVKAYPGTQPSLRDTGQLEIAQVVAVQAHPSWSPAMEVVVDARYGRAADQVLFGPSEIQHHEIERRALDFQAPYRAAKVKRDALAAQHRRPVRLVIVLEDTRRNRAALEPHADLIRRELPAGSREVWHSIRSGEPLGRDGLLWVRRPRRAT